MEHGLYAPESETMPVIFEDIAPPSHRPFGRGRPRIPAVTPHFNPALSPDKSRWASLAQRSHARN